MSRVLTVGAVALALALAACSAGDDDVTAGTAVPSTAPAATADDTEPAPTDARPVDTEAGPVGTAPPGVPVPFDPGPIEWEEYDEGLDTATVTVPVDYADPDGETLDLFVVRFRALDEENRIGSLLVNPGGPGAPGSELALFAAYQFDRPLLDHFDIIGWDPRGTGESDPAIECIDDDDYDRLYAEIDSTPDAAGEREALVAAAEEFANGCVERSGELLPFVGTNNAARDIDSIRRALGEEQVSYFGFSYGSELGATWATLFPDTVRAAVLDGAVDPNADSLQSSLQQTSGFEQSVVTFLERCDARPNCSFDGDPDGDGDAEEAFLDLMGSLDSGPIPSDDGRPPVNRDVATQAVIQAMYVEDYWPALEQSLAAAQDGDGSGLLELYDAYFRRNPDGSYGNMLEAFQAIECADTPERETVDEVDAQADLFEEAAPHLVPSDSAGGYFCTFFPPAADPRTELTAAGAGPIVVIGTTGDPATPFESTVAMAEALEEGVLIRVEAEGHLGYGSNECVVEAVSAYLVELTPPEDGLECSGGFF